MHPWLDIVPMKGEAPDRSGASRLVAVSARLACQRGQGTDYGKVTGQLPGPELMYWLTPPHG